MSYNHNTCMYYDHSTCMYYDHSTCMYYDYSTCMCYAHSACMYCDHITCMCYAHSTCMYYTNTTCIPVARLLASTQLPSSFCMVVARFLASGQRHGHQVPQEKMEMFKVNKGSTFVHCSGSATPDSLSPFGSTSFPAGDSILQLILPWVPKEHRLLAAYSFRMGWLLLEVLVLLHCDKLRDHTMTFCVP